MNLPGLSVPRREKACRFLFRGVDTRWAASSSPRTAFASHTRELDRVISFDRERGCSKRKRDPMAKIDSRVSRRRFFLQRCPLLFIVCIERRDTRESILALDPRFVSSKAAFTIERNHAIQFTRIDANAVRGELLAAHRVSTPPKQKSASFFATRNGQSLASHLRVRGLRSSERECDWSCEWTSLTQISFSRSAKACGASAKSAAVRMNSRRVTIAAD